jgi:hypothetical protein
MICCPIISPGRVLLATFLSPAFGYSKGWVFYYP